MHIRAIIIHMDVASCIRAHAEDTLLAVPQLSFDVVLSLLAGKASKFSVVAEGLMAASVA